MGAIIIGVIILIALLLMYFRSKKDTYKSAKIVEKSEDGAYWFYVKPYGSYVGEDPILIEVDEHTFDMFEEGEYVTI